MTYSQTHYNVRSVCLTQQTDLDAEKLQNQAKDLLLKGRKQHALMALKIRKIKLKEVASVDSKLLNVVQMVSNPCPYM